MTFTGQSAPPKYPQVAAGALSGELSTLAASQIITMLDKIALRVAPGVLQQVESTLVHSAPGLTMDQLGKVIARAEAFVDPDGIEPREDELHTSRSAIIHERGGMVHLTAKLDPETAAPIFPGYGGESEVLDWGRQRRLFSRPQRLALAEHDGGCAMCGLPPGMTKAHHIKWWHRDTGHTDLNNGVLLCTGCHHRVHDNGWDVRIDETPPSLECGSFHPHMWIRREHLGSVAATASTTSPRSATTPRGGRLCLEPLDSGGSPGSARAG